MLTIQARKNRVVLEDYNYKRDIQYRLFLSSLSIFESELLQEIIDGSLTTTTEKISESLEVDESDILPLLDKLSQINLIQRQDKLIFVDKELRKYFETHSAKFDDDFKPNIEFLHGLLNKVPIHILPNWYAIPRTSDDIFQSIIEKYMITPKTYSSYLKELTFDSTTLNDIFHDIYTTPGYQLSAKQIMKKYCLSHEAFLECMLHLEYNFICCISYKQIENKWEEIVTPFYEWHDYLLFQRTTAPNRITKTNEIKRHHPDNFGFISDLNAILHYLQNRPLPLEELEKDFTLPETICLSMFPHASTIPNPEILFSNIIATAVQLKLAAIKENTLHALPKSEEWLLQSQEEQAMIVYRHPDACYRHLSKNVVFCDRDLRETEKNLRRILHSGWVYYDEFIQGFTAPIGNTEAISLTKKGTHWSYVRPIYSESELQIIQNTIFGRLFEAGIVATGLHNGRLCFSVTSFGQEIMA